MKYIQEVGGFSGPWEISKDANREIYAGLKKTTIITSAGASTRIEGAQLTDEEIVQKLEGLHIKKIQDRDEAEVGEQIGFLKKLLIPKKPGRLTALADKTLEAIRTNQPVSIGFLERQTGIKRVTLKNILSRLKDENIIEMEGSRKGSLYRIKG